MMKQRGWTKQEVDTLQRLYPTMTTLLDIQNSLPSRSPNSIRIMASRLGLRRPTFLTGIEKAGEIKTSASAGGGVLVRCSKCGGWVGLTSEKANGGIIFCGNCGCISLVGG
ncbi:MAG: hypothetical protein ABSA11_12015 [Candidatus Bathyarchaeia archaeon]